jgi:uncharacterized membrane protein
MDSIDITSPEFSLDVNEVISNTVEGVNDYTFYIYIAIAIVVIVIAFFLYKYYVNTKKRVTFQDKLDDCYGEQHYET